MTRLLLPNRNFFKVPVNKNHSGIFIQCLKKKQCYKHRGLILHFQLGIVLEWRPRIGQGRVGHTMNQMTKRRGWFGPNTEGGTPGVRNFWEA